MFDWFDDAMDFISDGFDWLVDGAKSVGSDIVDTISSEILEALDNFIGGLAYAVTSAFLKLVQMLYSIFSVFSGISKISYDGNSTYLTNIFFENEAISGVYWGMVMLSIVLMIVFAIISVIRKMYDLGDRQQHSIGQILGGCFKSVLVMITMTAVITSGITLTNELIRRVNYIFDKNKALLQQDEIVFTDEQFATMARIYNTIGNYSLNPSYTQRFNLNSCYNELRGDLSYLQSQGVFDLVYPDMTGDVKDPTWQSELQKLVQTANPNLELKMDPYYTAIYDVLEEIMKLLRTDPEFFPVERIKNEYAYQSTTVSLDRILFLTGTMDAAINSAYNENPAIDDGLRGAFYTGEKSIYSQTDVSHAFRMGITGINYVMILFLTYHVLRSLYHCILNCGARLINMVGLYLIAPPVAAVIPLDDGQKFREWITSMVIQAFGIFGNIIPMRLLILFVPMILDSKLVLLPNTMLNLVAKVILIVALIESFEKFGGILTGILANSAGSAAIRASGLDEEADKLFDSTVGRLNPFNGRKDKKKGKGGGNGGNGGGGGGFGGNGGSAAEGAAAAANPMAAAASALGNSGGDDSAGESPSSVRSTFLGGKKQEDSPNSPDQVYRGNPQDKQDKEEPAGEPDNNAAEEPNDSVMPENEQVSVEKQENGETKT